LALSNKRQAKLLQLVGGLSLTSGRRSCCCWLLGFIEQAAGEAAAAGCLALSNKSQAKLLLQLVAWLYLTSDRRSCCSWLNGFI
jgi:hypothetical protein